MQVRGWKGEFELGLRFKGSDSLLNKLTSQNGVLL